MYLVAADDIARVLDRRHIVGEDAGVFLNVVGYGKGC